MSGVSSPLSTKRPDHIEYSLWLVFDDRGGVRLARRRPSLSRNERAMAITAKLPLTLFSTPELKASISVDPSNVSSVNFDLDQVGSILSSALGIEVDLKVK